MASAPIQPEERSAPKVAEVESAKRNLTGVLGQIVRIIAILGALFQLYTAATVPLTAVVQRAVHLTYTSAMLFLLTPGWRQKDKNRVPIPDLLLSALSVVAVGYLVVTYANITPRIGSPLLTDVVMGVMTTLIVLEGSRRVMGWPLTAICAIFLLYGRFGYLVPGRLGHIGYDIERMMSCLYLSADGIFGTPLGVSATYVAAFVIFGAFYRVAGGGQFIIDVAFSFLGHVRGGAAKIAVMASSLFGTISGSVVANVVSTGTFTIPMMKKTGFRPEWAGAVECCASTGGMIMPPVMGAAAFIIPEILGISYWNVAVAAIIPALLYYAALYFSVDRYAALNNLKGVPRSELPSLWLVLKRDWPLMLPLVVLVVELGVLMVSAIRAALWATVLTVVIAILKKRNRLTVQQFLACLESSARGMIEVAFGCAAAGIIVGIFSLTGLGLKLSYLLILLSHNSLPLLLVLSTIASLILGMGVTTTAAYIILAVLVAPSLIEMGVVPMAAHLFLFYYGCLANITPPVALGAFAAAGIAGANPMTVGFLSELLVLPGLIVPFLFVYQPALIFQGAPTYVLWCFGTALLGVWLLASGLQGYMFCPMKKTILRVGAVVAAFLLIVPETITDIVGLGLGALIIAVEWLAQRAGARAAVQRAA